MERMKCLHHATRIEESLSHTAAHCTDFLHAHHISTISHIGQSPEPLHWLWLIITSLVKWSRYWKRRGIELIPPVEWMSAPCQQHNKCIRVSPAVSAFLCMSFRSRPNPASHIRRNKRNKKHCLCVLSLIQLIQPLWLRNDQISSSPSFRFCLCSWLLQAVSSSLWHCAR